MSTLYRKYRPQSFKEIYGQNHIKLTLESEIESGNIGHAYLFCGPRGIGKTTMARVVAKAVNCPAKKKNASEPCNKCDICDQITKGKCLDIIEIDAASHTGVDNVRENVISISRVAPSQTSFRIFIIDEVHMLSISAFNALLKILEEPPVNVIFILCTTEVHKIPLTIISRCQRFDFKKINIDEVIKRLQYVAAKEEVKIDKNILLSIALHSDGHLRDAETLLGQIIAIGGNNITQKEADIVIPRSDINEAVNLINFILKKDAAAAIGLVNKLVDEGIDLKNFTADLIELLRKIMIAKLSPQSSAKLAMEFGENIEKRLTVLIESASPPQLINIIEKFMAAKNDQKDSFIVQLPLELAIASLCLAAAPAPIMPRASAGEPRSMPPSATVKSANSANNTQSGIKYDPSISISLDVIQSGWNEVLAKIKKYNHSLSFILRVCQLKSVVGNRLCVVFKYKFHKDRIDNLNIKTTLENLLKEVYNLPLIIEAVVDETIEFAPLEEEIPAQPNSVEAGAGVSESAVEEDKSENMINSLLKTFGGKVVD